MFNVRVAICFYLSKIRLLIIVYFSFDVLAVYVFDHLTLTFLDKRKVYKVVDLLKNSQVLVIRHLNSKLSLCCRALYLIFLCTGLRSGPASRQQDNVIVTFPNVAFIYEYFIEALVRFADFKNSFLSNTKLKK